MKKLACSYAFSLFLILFGFFATEVFAQQPAGSTGAPNLTVISKSWRATQATRRRQGARSEPPKANTMEDQVKILKNIQDNEERARRGLPPERAPSHSPPELIVRTSKYNLYIYEVNMKNTGNKKIRSVTWDYVAFERGTNREMGRRNFVSKVNIRAGEEKKVTEKSTSPPAYIVGAAVVVNDPSDQYIEEVIIRSIEYADGSVWKP